MEIGHYEISLYSSYLLCYNVSTWIACSMTKGIQISHLWLIYSRFFFFQFSSSSRLRVKNNKKQTQNWPSANQLLVNKKSYSLLDTNLYNFQKHHETGVRSHHCIEAIKWLLGKRKTIRWILRAIVITSYTQYTSEIIHKIHIIHLFFKSHLDLTCIKCFPTYFNDHIAV